MNNNQLKRRVEELEAEVKRLKPVRGVGLLTSQQSRGVIRRPTRSTRIQGGGGVPRWA
jgi:hypothetical protein